jgi:hypothetical protein
LPRVTIDRKDNPKIGLSLSLIKAATAVTAAKELSVGEWPLTEKDFSFKVNVEGSEDKFQHDVLIIISAHAFPERVEKADWIAECIKTYVLAELARAGKPPLNIEVMVELMPLGWSGKPPSTNS